MHKAVSQQVYVAAMETLQGIEGTNPVDASFDFIEIAVASHMSLDPAATLQVLTLCAQYAHATQVGNVAATEVNKPEIIRLRQHLRQVNGVMCEMHSAPLN